MYDTGTLVVSSNSVSGPAVIEDNSGPVAPTVSANTVGGPLECSGNTPAPGDAGSANKASGGAQGQCATLA